MQEFLKIVILILLVFSVVFGVLYFMYGRKSLNNIKAERVGDGQHGNAEWATEEDFKNHDKFRRVKFPKEMKDMSLDWEVGRVLHWDEKGYAWVDTSDQHAAVQAPTEIGKTTRFVIPNIMYNAMAGANIIAPSIKGELSRILGNDLKEKLGYNVVVVNFMDVERSVIVDYMERINENILLMGENPKRKSYYSAVAETQAKILAEAITSSRERSSTENGFFKSASSGLISCVTYLVSLFGNDNTKHLSSVRAIIQDLGGARKDEKSSALQELLKDFPPDFPPRKLAGAAYTAPMETEGNIYSSALSDLDLFSNALAEQVVAVNGKDRFNWKEFMDPDKKTIVFIELPETRKDMYVFFSLFIRQFYEQISEAAMKLPGLRLPRTCKIEWDEFGISPRQDDMPEMLNIMRGRGIICDLIYQSDEQLEDKYGATQAEIIKKACNVNLVLGLSPRDIKTAKDLSQILGEYTVKTGSVSRSYSSKDAIFGETGSSVSEQMQARALMSADELLRMGAKSILIKQNMKPFRPHNMPYWSKDFPTRLMDKEPYTENQRIILDKLCEIATEESFNYKKLDQYEKFIQDQTVESAEELIITLRLYVQDAKWIDVEYIAYDDLVESLDKLNTRKKRKRKTRYDNAIQTTLTGVLLNEAELYALVHDLSRKFIQDQKLILILNKIKNHTITEDERIEAEQYLDSNYKNNYAAYLQRLSGE